MTKEEMDRRFLTPLEQEAIRAEFSYQLCKQNPGVPKIVTNAWANVARILAVATEDLKIFNPEK